MLRSGGSILPASALRKNGAGDFAFGPATTCSISTHSPPARQTGIASSGSSPTLTPPHLASGSRLRPSTPWHGASLDQRDCDYQRDTRHRQGAGWVAS